MMKREEQQKLLSTARERLQAHAKRWLKVPAIKAAAHRKDEKVDAKRQRRRETACA